MKDSSSKIISNTMILYGKMVLSIGLVLLTTRLVLEALGTVDYGVFELIAGLITMLSFLNTAMTVSTQRYFSYYQGKKDTQQQKKIFSNSLLLHIFIGFILVITFKIIGGFLFGGLLNIPSERINSAEHIYFFMSITVFFSIISVPFIAILNARENMLFISIVYLLEVLCKLGIAISLFSFSGDSLIFYGLSMALVSFLSFFIYFSFCIRKYTECSFQFKANWDFTMIHSLASFAGWNLVGALCSVGKVQGIAVILNIFYGTVINAAYGIANQISSQMTFLSLSMLRAINPQIMKNEGEGNRKRMMYLSMSACKFGFLLFSTIAIPCMFEMKHILEFWLNVVPEYTNIFCVLLLISIMISQISIGLQSAIQAIGRIKLYQSIVGAILLLNVPASLLLLYSNFPIYSVFICMIVIELFALMFRLLFLKSIAHLSIVNYFQQVVIKSFIPILFSIFLCFICTELLVFSYRFIFTGFVSVFTTILITYLYSLNENERIFVNAALKRVLKR